MCGKQSKGIFLDLLSVFFHCGFVTVFRHRNVGICFALNALWILVNVVHNNERRSKENFGKMRTRTEVILREKRLYRKQRKFYHCCGKAVENTCFLMYHSNKLQYFS